MFKVDESPLLNSPRYVYGFADLLRGFLTTSLYNTPNTHLLASSSPPCSLPWDLDMSRTIDCISGGLTHEAGECCAGRAEASGGKGHRGTVFLHTFLNGRQTDLALL